MHDDAVEVVGPERTVRAPRAPAGVVHEVVDDELAAAVEEVGQALLAAGPLEDVGLGHLLPGQVAAGLTELVAQARELLFLEEEPLAGLQPILVGNDSVLSHGTSSVVATVPR